MTMALVGRFLAAAFRQDICIFTLDKQARLVQHLAFGYAACFASITPYLTPLTSLVSSGSDFDSISSIGPLTFVLALSTLSGVRVYHVRLDTNEHFNLQFIWEYRTPKVEGIDLIEPVLDVSGGCVTWLEISYFNLRRQHRFCVAVLPSSFANADATRLIRKRFLTPNSTTPGFLRCTLRLLETMIKCEVWLVLGNAFGELAVCDFNGSSGQVPSYDMDSKPLSSWMEK